MTRGTDESGVSGKRDASTVNEEQLRKGPETVQDQAEMAHPDDSDAGDNVSGVVEQEEAAPKSEVEERETQESMTIPVAELEELKAEKDQYYDRLLRLKAEFENYKKRVQREFEGFSRYAAESVILEMLPVLDNFERALSDVPEGVNDGFRRGVEIIHQQLCEALGKVGLSPLETVGKKFDPNVHEALMEVESEDHDEGTVVQEFQKGYTLFDKVVRCAKVSVSSGKGEKDDIPDEGDKDVKDRKESNDR